MELLFTNESIYLFWERISLYGHVWPGIRLSWSSQRSTCLCLSVAIIEGVCHHGQLMHKVFMDMSVLCCCCAYKYVRVCTSRKRQKGHFDYPSLSCSLRQDLPLNLWVLWWQASPSNPPVPAHQNSRVLAAGSHAQVFTCVLGIRTQVFLLMHGTFLPTEPFYNPLFTSLG